MTEITCASGEIATINLGEWEDAKRLKREIEKEIVRTGANITLESDGILAVKTLLAVDASEEVDKALAPLLMRCLYKNEKITGKTFNSKEARGDYYDIIIACAQENIGPLVESLFARLQPIIKASLKKTTPTNQKNDFPKSTLETNSPSPQPESPSSDISEATPNKS